MGREAGVEGKRVGLPLFVAPPLLIGCLEGDLLFLLRVVRRHAPGQKRPGRTERCKDRRKMAVEVAQDI